MDSYFFSHNYTFSPPPSKDCPPRQSLGSHHSLLQRLPSMCSHLSLPINCPFRAPTHKINKDIHINIKILGHISSVKIYFFSFIAELNLH